MQIVTQRGVTGAGISIMRNDSIQALIAKIAEKPSSVLLVTVHQGRVTQIAEVTRPVQVADLVQQIDEAMPGAIGDDRPEKQPETEADAPATGRPRRNSP